MNFVYADGHAKWARSANNPNPKPDRPYEWGYYPVLMADQTCTPP